MRRDLYQEVTDKIIAMMQEHGSDWVKPWKIDGQPNVPTNAVTKKAYRGINVWLCWAAGHTHFASYKQWQSIDAQVRKGEKATKIYFFKPMEKETISDTGERKKDRWFMLREYSVFNADQVDGFEYEKPSTLVDPISECETFAKNTSAVLCDGGNRAFYRPSTDTVHMPSINGFDNAESYYSTLFHELTHWTKQPHRCDRQFSKRFGDQAYAMEELVAELGAAYTCAGIGISAEPRPDHAKYLNTWIEVLKDNNRAIFTASSQAMKAADYLETLQEQKIAA